MKNFFSEKYKTVLFHLCLWSIWLILPLLNAREEELRDRSILMFLMIFSTHIPLFFINSSWLVPKILHKKGTTYYVLSLLGMIFIFGIFHFFIQEWSKEHLLSFHKKQKSFVWNFMPMIMVAAISTGYALLDFVAKEAHLKQAKKQEQLQSELAFLRSQISPHFIFNVLNSIVYLIRMKSDLAEPVTIKLSELMRYMLYESANAQISLEKELGYLDNYIALQKLRFEDDVAVVFQKKGMAMGQIIEPMLLIPFVENAFKHGVGLIKKPIIDLNLVILADKIIFSVRNKIAPETTSDLAENSGIGLKNVRRRLELLYPNTHQLSVKTDADGYFLVELKLTFLNPMQHDA
jgi:two-component system, LytTR family, sensor kinase